MKQTALDLRVDRTFSKLKDAIFSIIEENGAQMVSVKLLCERAGISRPTFYDYFHSVQDLLDYFTDQYITGLQKGVEKYLRRKPDYRSYYTWLLTYIRKNQKEFRCLYTFDFRTNFIQKTDAFCAGAGYGIPDKSRFCQYGANAIIRQWLEDGCRAPVRSVAEFLTAAVCGVMKL